MAVNVYDEKLLVNYLVVRTPTNLREMPRRKNLSQLDEIEKLTDFSSSLDKI